MWRAWLLLFTAIIFEVLGTSMMKLSTGFSVLLPSILIFVFYSCSFTLLVYSLKYLSLSLAYAIWAGLGTTLIAIIGVTFFQEPMTPLTLFGIILVIMGVVCLKIGNRRHA